jgi:voltage-gated potassium channel
MLSALLFKLAVAISQNTRYIQTKRTIDKVLNDTSHPYNKFVVFAILFFIFSSVYILIANVKHDIPEAFLIYEVYFITFVFSIEYLLRLWVYSDVHKIIIKHYEQRSFLNRKHSFFALVYEVLKDKFKYIASPLAIIDLLAIIPAYRPLRILRIFLLFRIFKILRYTNNINQFFEVLKSKKVEFYTLGMLLSFVVFTGGVSIYIFEANTNDKVDTLFDGIYWALVTISTVGFGDIAPQTTAGRIASMVLILSGIGIISFSTSLIVTSFSESVRENKLLYAMQKKEGFVIICGYGQLAKTLISMFENKNTAYIVIEKNEQLYKQAVVKGVKIINDDATKHKAFARFDFTQVKAVICATSDDIANIYVTLNIRSIDKNVKILARSSNETMDKKLLLAGADRLIKPYEIAGMMTQVYLNEPNAFDAINAILTGKKNAYVEEFKVSYDNFLHNRKVAHTFKESKLILLGLFRNEKFIFNPPEDFILNADDTVIVLGYSTTIEWFKTRLFSKKDY